MSYQAAIEKAWKDVADLKIGDTLSVKFLSDAYSVDLKNKTVLSESCNIPAKDHIVIIILHYLIQKIRLKSLPAMTGEWIDFNQLDGGEAYYPAFKRRTIDHVLKKYGSNPEALLNVTERMPAQKAGTGEAGIIIKPFEGLAILITMWKADEEFGPSANILFDKNIRHIFCTEDIVVLTEILVHQL